MSIDDLPPRALSGPGKLILEEILKPQLSDAVQYDRVSSYYNPRSLFLLLREFSEIWKQGRSIRLIIGFHEKLEISPALRREFEVKKAIRDAVRKAIEGDIHELAELAEEKKEEMFSILRELINREALQVRLVAPRVSYDYYLDTGRWPKPEAAALFHSKFSVIHKRPPSDRSTARIQKTLVDKIRRIFRFGPRRRDYYRSSFIRLERGEKFSVVVGSANESVGGYGENIEDVVLHRSWIDSEQDVAAYFVDRFEALWIDAAEDVVSMPFEEEFERIVERVEQETKQELLGWADFWGFVSESPSYHGLAFPNIGLLPHQIRVYREALNRWPIRALLADEVGLGKTIEAGSIIHYLKEHGGARRVAILVPASLRPQWQKELKNLFDLDFWVYDPSKGTCELDDDVVQVGDQPLSRVENVILSWHWARRGVTDESSRFDDQEMPDLLVVDEAHHARRRKSISGETAPTQLHTLLMHMQKRVPHVLLLTATPFQTSQLDYFSLLEILGTPSGFDEGRLERFARWTKGELHETFSYEVQQIKQLHSTTTEYGIAATEEPVSFISEEESTDDTEFYEKFIRSHGAVAREIILKYHPTTLLTLRNTRRSLAKQGYEFPQVNLLGSDIHIDDKQAEWFDDLEDYIQSRLGYVLSGTNTRGNIGLMRSLYRQRVVSSIKAALDTLDRRRRNLQEFLRTKDVGLLSESLGDEFSSADNEPTDSAPPLVLPEESDVKSKGLIEKAKTEMYHLDRLVGNMERFFSEAGSYKDPKMLRLKELVSEHVKAGRKVLVFSRFTSTTGSVVVELADHARGARLGRFDGVHVGVYNMMGSDMKLIESDDKGIVRKLQSDAISVLVCSDKASEGLNLHAANVAINVDVPWSPTRLLQRFGRVDRLGQKAKEVFLINLYYPNTVEEKMWKVLEDRRIDFRALLGEVPEIVSEQQRRVISDLAQDKGPHVSMTYELIETARETFNDNQFNHLIVQEETTGLAQSIQSKLIEIVAEGAENAGNSVIHVGKDCAEIEGQWISSDPLNENFTSWDETVWEGFETVEKENGTSLEIRQLESRDGTPLALVVKRDNEVFPLTSRDWQRLFEFIFKGTPVSLEGLSRFGIQDVDQVLRFVRENDSWIWPDHGKMRSISESTLPFPAFEGISIGKSLGCISVVSGKQG